MKYLAHTIPKCQVSKKMIGMSDRYTIDVKKFLYLCKLELNYSQFYYFQCYDICTEMHSFSNCCIFLFLGKLSKQIV